MKLNCGQEDKKIYSGFVFNDANSACEKVRMIVAGIENLVGINSDQSFDVRVILSELLQNAIKHGNHTHQQKKVYMNVRICNKDVLSITVEDQGHGFDACRVIQEEQTRQICAVSELMECGRGLQIVKSLCDEMVFNDTGNCITVTKRLV